MDKRNIVIGLLATVAVISLVNAAATMGSRARMIQLENRIDHLDEEVDEIGVGIKRIVSRGNMMPAASGTKQTRTPEAEIEKKEYDFGKITKRGGVVRAIFPLKNTGKETLSIGEIFTSCGCTTATSDMADVPAGETATITVAFDPNFHAEPQGRFSRSVYIPTNDPNNTEIELKIFVEITD